MRRLGVAISVVCFGIVGCQGGGVQAKTFYDQSATETGGRLDISSTDFKDGDPIPDKDAGDNGVPPDFSWSSAPGETNSFVVIVEDPDAPGDKPFVHWLVTAIPPTAKSLASGGVLGKNSDGKNAYFGPKPPAGKPHHYHIEVFALDEALPQTPYDRDGLLKDISGHVIAKGELIGTYQTK